MEGSSNAIPPKFDVSTIICLFSVFSIQKYVKYKELYSIDYKGMSKKELSVKNSQISP